MKEYFYYLTTMPIKSVESVECNIWITQYDIEVLLDFTAFHPPIYQKSNKINKISLTLLDNSNKLQLLNSCQNSKTHTMYFIRPIYTE